MGLPIVEGFVWFVTTTMTWIGLPGLFLLMLVESFGIPPLPSEVILPFAGFLVAEGTFGLPGALTAAIAGAMVGAFLAYAVGRWGRAWITGRGARRFGLNPEHLHRVDRWFQRRGELIVAGCRLLPVFRAYVSYPAGFARMNPAKFGGYTLLGTVPFVLGFVYAGIALRSNWTLVSSWFSSLDDVLVAVIVAAAIYLALVVFRVVEFGWPPRRPSRGGSPAGGPAPAPVRDEDD